VNRVVVDASALAAIAFDEPAGDAVARQLDGATVFAPTLLKFEMANTAWKKVRRQRADAERILRALALCVSPRGGIIWREVDLGDVVQIADATGLSAYDASYLWLAGSLGADLVTLDTRLAHASAAL
jgi:predicted nucleic acid-binding protein